MAENRNSLEGTLQRLTGQQVTLGINGSYPLYGTVGAVAGGTVLIADGSWRDSGQDKADYYVVLSHVTWVR